MEGWEVLQRRMNGTEDFYCGWSDYLKESGDLSGKFWLGLNKDKQNHKQWHHISKGTPVLQIQSPGPLPPLPDWWQVMYIVLPSTFKSEDTVPIVCVIVLIFGAEIHPIVISEAASSIPCVYSQI